MYTFKSRVRYSETDETGCLGLDAIINYLQDCTNFESEDLGVGIDFLDKNHIMWILSSWQIVVGYYPSFGERIEVGTQAYGYDKMMGFRNFFIKLEDGSVIVKANSNLVLMDMEKCRPVIIKPEIVEVYGRHDGQEKESFIVKEYHLDTNHHVNNGQYVRMAMLALGIREKAKELRVEYKRQALLGNKIIPVVYNGKNMAFVSLNGEDGKAYAVVQFIF